MVICLVWWLQPLSINDYELITVYQLCVCMREWRRSRRVVAKSKVGWTKESILGVVKAYTWVWQSSATSLCSTLIIYMYVFRRRQFSYMLCCIMKMSLSPCGSQLRNCRLINMILVQLSRNKGQTVPDNAICWVLGNLAQFTKYWLHWLINFVTCLYFNHISF